MEKDRLKQLENRFFKGCRDKKAIFKQTDRIINNLNKITIPEYRKLYIARELLEIYKRYEINYQED